MRKGMDIKLPKTNIRKQVGGSLLTSILTLGRTLAPTLSKTIGLSGLAGLTSEGESQIVKKISGSGIQSGGFLHSTKSKIDQLIAYKLLANQRNKRLDILNALTIRRWKTCNQTNNKAKHGGFLGTTLLASIGLPLAIEAIKKMTGKGAPRMGSDIIKGGSLVHLN